MKSECRVVRDEEGVSIRYVKGTSISGPLVIEAPTLQELSRLLADMRSALGKPVVEAK